MSIVRRKSVHKSINIKDAVVNSPVSHARTLVVFTVNTEGGHFEIELNTIKALTIFNKIPAYLFAHLVRNKEHDLGTLRIDRFF